MQEESLVLIGSNTTGSGRDFAKVALRRGLRTILLSGDESDYGLGDLANLKIVPLNLKDSIAVREEIGRIAEKTLIRGIWSTSEYWILTAAKLASERALSGSKPESIELARDKGSQRRVFDQHGVASPRSTTVRSIEESVAASERIGLPVCIKPAAASGSVGVRIARDPEQVRDATTVALVAGSSPGVVIVEEYVDGPEFSVEIFDGQPVAVTQKALGGLFETLEIAHCTPAEIPSVVDESLRRVALEATSALGLEFGPAHVELRVREEVPYIIEVNPRLAGGMIPELIRLSTGLDLLEATLDRVLGLNPSLDREDGPFAAIAFAIAVAPGELRKSPELEPIDGVYRSGLLKPPGTHIVPQGDFRDRFGYAISVHDQCAEALECAKRGARHLEEMTFMAEPETGLLKRSLRPELRQILFGEEISSEHLELLTHYASIDKAHLIMQVESKLLRLEDAAKVLRGIVQLEETEFRSLIGRPLHRGLYLAYETALKEEVGPQGARAMHVSRSRNDIGATVHRLQLRGLADRVLEKGLGLVSSLLSRAQEADAVMPLYTQHLPAMPGSLGHYLLGVASALVREMTSYNAALLLLEECPLGAGAGGGTDLPIQPDRSANLLGFKRPIANSIDAVSSRDADAHLLASGALIAVLLSRFATDLQAWARAEVAMISFPDDLVGSSSALPQKRNHFLLEHIQSRACSSLGQFVTTCTAQQATPFSNSVAVGTESIRRVAEVMSDLDQTLLITLNCVEGFCIDRQRMTSLASRDDVLAPILAERLRRETHMPFREAHHLLGQLLREDSGLPLVERLRQWAVNEGINGLWLKDLGINDLVLAAEYGGGPGEASRKAQESQLQAWLESLTAQLEVRRRRYERAATKLCSRTRQLILLGKAESLNPQ